MWKGNKIMSLIPWSPFLDTFDNLEKNLSNFIPSIDIYEKKDSIVVEATLAGIKPEDVDINLKDDVLVIEGKRKVSSEVDEKNYYRKEVRSGSFHRTIALPISVKAKKAEADFKNGLLTITLPKEGKVKSNKIKINIK